MKAALLPDRGVVKVAGDDARKFLNGLITATSPRCTPARPGFAALLTPQGKIIVDFIVAEAPPADGGGFFLDCPRALAPALVQRLNFYKLRAKVDGRGPVRRARRAGDLGRRPRPPNMACAIPTRACRRWGCAACCRRTWPTRPRPTSARSCVDAADYEAHRIALGVPRGGLDFIYGDAFPHETDMDQLGRRRFRQGLLRRPGGGVAHRASRHRAHARGARAFDGFAPEAGTPVRPATRPSARSARRRKAAALPCCGSTAPRTRSPPARRSSPAASRLRLVKPAWARFAWPGEAKAARMSALPLLHPDGLKRCPWPKHDPLYVAYHDEEWGVPEYDDRALYEKLMLDGFQAGLSWITILRKRDNFRRAFDGFEPEKIARYTPKQSRAADAGRRHRAQPRRRSKARCSRRAPISTSWRKARASRDCSGTSSTASRRSITSAPRRRCRRKPTLSRKIRRSSRGRGFKFVGPTIVYAFMQAVGMVNDHLVTCHRHAALRQAREAVDAGAAEIGSARVRAVPRAWQRMLSGRRLDLLDPSPLDVEIEDIAHGLARVARWNGQTEGAHIFSVAQHSLLVEIIARQRARLDRPSRLARAAARRARIRDRRHDLAVQGGDRRRLQGGRGAAARRHPSALRPAGRAAGGARSR